MIRGASQSGFGAMVLGSLGVHAGLVALVWLLANLAPRLTPPPQAVLVTKLVRLGTPRPKELLPRKEEPPPPPPPPPPPVATPPAAAAPPPPTPAPPKVSAAPAAGPAAKGPSAKERVSAMSRTSSALERLKKLDGQKDGDAAGDVADADLAVLGNQYGSEVSRCLQQNYVIEGTDPTRVANLQAKVLLHIAADGTITTFRIEEGSGNAAFDHAVGRAVERCKHLSPPPAALRTQVRRDGFEITFTR